MTTTMATTYIPRMDPDVKAAWVAALRSQQYQQGNGQLHNPATDAYCCLGVLCDVQQWPRQADGGETAFLLPEDMMVRFRVRRWTGAIPAVYGIPMFAITTLIDMNDAGKSFSEIADWIEGNL